LSKTDHQYVAKELQKVFVINDHKQVKVMKNFMLMEPTNQTFAELLSNGSTFSVPKFQRDYAWDLMQWEDLWEDIETLAEEHYHYMGYIVLQEKGQYEFEIIDGQQRMVTMSLIILSVMRHLRNFINDNKGTRDNEERLQEISNRFIGSKDLVSLRVRSKLTLNRNNNRFYRDICSHLSPPNQRGLITTNHLLKQAFDFFYSKHTASSGAELAQFVTLLTSRMIFTKIVVQDSLNAYKIFETLNARGLQLSIPDLLKNYLFSVVTSKDDISDERLSELDESWATILAQLGEYNFTDFIRFHFNFQHTMVPKQEIFKAIRTLYNTPQIAYAYLYSLDQYASIYASLLNPYDEWWKSQSVENNKIKKYLEGFKLFAIKQPLSLLMIAFDQFSPEEFVKTLKYLYNLSVRYNIICRFSPNLQEKAYNTIALKIYNGEYKRGGHIKNSKEFKQLYPDDNTFRNAFEFYKLPGRQFSRQIRFLLSDIENSFGRELNYLDTTLEHVFPYHPNQSWYEEFGEGANDIIDRLGNMVLLEKDTLQRTDFKTKKSAYSKTSFVLAKKVAQYDTWDLPNLNHYQQWLSEQAVKTWRVD